VDPGTPSVESAQQAALQFRQPQYGSRQRSGPRSRPSNGSTEAYVVQINPRVLARSRSENQHPEDDVQPQM